MEKQEFTFDPSLKEVIFRKIAIVLWQQAGVFELINSFKCPSFASYDTMHEWRESIENVVKEKASVLLLPGSLQWELNEVIKVVGPEILLWKMHLESLISDSYFALDQLCWTAIGTVDYRKTAEILIKQERITILSRYKIACIYCKEDDIRSIWEKLPEHSKELLYDEDVMLVRQSELVIFWTYFIKGEVTKLDILINGNEDERRRSPYQFAFESAALSGNRTATEYFFQLLTSEELEASLLETTKKVIRKRCLNIFKSFHDFPREKFCDVLSYLLSQMRKEDQIRVFRRHPYKTLFCFLDWPWQYLFMRIVGLMWTVLPDHKYETLLFILGNNRTFSGYNYSKLFEELFLGAPSRFRTYLIDTHQRRGILLLNTIYTGNTTNIKLVLRSLDEKDRQRIIICDTGYHICRRLIDEERWLLLGFFISECRLSSDAKRILKNGFKFYLTRSDTGVEIKLSKPQCDKFFLLIDNASVKDDKIVEEAVKEERLIQMKRPRRQ